MQTSDIDVKRRAEGRGDRIRVMTVHGAKGLESPIVFLPDTGWKRKRGQVDERILAAADGTPIWKPRSGEMPQSVTALRDDISRRRREEGQRLLYVAMTRAEQWLVVGAAGDLGKAGDTWVEQIGASLARAGAVDHDFGFGPGQRLESPFWKAARPDRDTAETEGPPSLPDWATRKAAAPDRPEQTVSPSGLGGAKALPGENAGLTEEEAMARGTRLHLLLEHLPGVPRDRRADVARQLLRDAADADALRAEAEAVIDAPGLAHLFGPETLAEVEIVAPLPALGGATLSGTIDRLLVEPERVLAVDFKSNAAVPDTPDQVPDGLLRQMGAYAAALALIYPGRRIETALLWTRSATLMPLPEPLTRAALTAAHETVSATPPP